MCGYSSTTTNVEIQSLFRLSTQCHKDFGPCKRTLSEGSRATVVVKSGENLDALEFALVDAVKQIMKVTERERSNIANAGERVEFQLTGSMETTKNGVKLQIA